MISYIKIALTNPKDSYKAQNMKGKNIFFYYAFLILILTLSTLGEQLPLFRSLEEDGPEVAESIPDFTIEDEHLQSDHSSYVYQTESMLFFFDPNGEIETESISQNVNRLPASIGIGLLEEEMIINFEGVSRPIGYNHLQRLTPLTPEVLRSILSDLNLFSPIMLGTLFISLYIAMFLTAFMDYFILALFANVLAALLRSSFRFAQTVKVILLATTLPTVLLAVANILQWDTPYQYEMRIGFSLILFALSIIEMKKTNTSK